MATNLTINQAELIVRKNNINGKSGATYHITEEGVRYFRKLINASIAAGDQITPAEVMNILREMGDSTNSTSFFKTL